MALLAPVITNTGQITGKDVALAAGTEIALDFAGDGLLSVVVESSTLATLIENKGVIIADGGTATLTARAASGGGGGGGGGGGILLLADMEHGEANVAGRLDAHFVETSAARVTLDTDLNVDTKGGEWLIDPIDITIDASKASAIQTALGTGSVTVTTADNGSNPWGTNGTGTDAGTITVDASITWNANILTLRADNTIILDAELTSTGTTSSDGLVLQYAQTTGTGTYAINAPVTLAAGSLFQTKKGSDSAITYTVITDLGAEGSTTQTDLQGINTGRIAGDALTVASATGAFADKNAGDDKTVTITGLALGGPDKDNYTLDEDTATTIATITPRAVSLSGSRVYDGTVDLAAAIFTLDTLANGEALTLFGTGSMSEANAGTGKTVTLTGLSLGDGTGLAANYTLGSGLVTINKASLVVTAGDAMKIYDGQAFTGGNGVTYGGFVDHESASVLTGTLAYGGAAQNAVSAGTYPLTVSGLSADNHTITYGDAALTITAIQIRSSTLAMTDAPGGSPPSASHETRPTVTTGSNFGNDDLSGGPDQGKRDSEMRTVC
ncbi:MAG: hypothetical protein FD149_1310 [Rhodospirillaceae bacterium]|nr:MAG: hypothetical protein FD149_1310 [Rhodospirillaceae bacterium]